MMDMPEKAPLDQPVVPPAEIPGNISVDSYKKKINFRKYFKPLALITIPVVGVVASAILVRINQDLRQQATDGLYSLRPISAPTPGPSPTSTQASVPTPTPISSRPTKEEDCEGHGKWIEAQCFLYGEVVDGTYIVMPPGTYNNYQYVTLQPLDKVEDYLSNNRLFPENELSQPITPSPVVQITSIPAPVDYPNQGYFNQLDPAWKSIPIEDSRYFGSVGCGVTSVANLTGVSPDVVLDMYPIGSPLGITSHGTGLEANAMVLEQMGWVTSRGPNGNGALEEEIRTANRRNDYEVVLTEMEKYKDEGGWEIMINGNFGSIGGGGHWAVIDDIDVVNNRVTVIDPNGGVLRTYELDVSGTSGDPDAITPKRLLLARNDNAV